MAASSLIHVPLALDSEYYLFGGAGIISLLAFGALIFWPALSSFSRPWEKIAAGFLSLFVLATLVIVGLAVGLIIFYNWNAISSKI